MLIAPFALLIGGIFTLNGLNADSELVIIGASGGSRARVIKPIMAASAVISLAMLVFTAWVAPATQHTLREEITKINVDLIANIVRPGRFTEIETGLTFHIRNRAGDGSLVGLVIDDQRDKEIALTYIADRANVVETPGKSFLVMRDGVIQRVTNKDGSLAVIDFEAYAFDLSQLTAQNAAPAFRPSERSTLDLLQTDTTTEEGRKNVGKFRGELVDRFSQPLLPLAFGVILLLMLGDAQTTRQGRGMAVVGTFALVLATRAVHFAAQSAAVGSAAAIPIAFLIPIGITLVGLFVLFTDQSIALPRPISEAIDWMVEATTSVISRWLNRNGPKGGAA